jgi:ribonucleoside-diphosphate reductase alpha chain
MLRLPLQVMKLKAESRNFETLYFAAVTASMEMAKLEGLIQHLKGLQSQGEFQHNLWNIKDEELAVGTGQH